MNIGRIRVYWMSKFRKKCDCPKISYITTHKKYEEKQAKREKTAIDTSQTLYQIDLPKTRMCLR